MKLPSTVNKKRRVEELIDSLKLNKCSDTKIGGPFVKGVSGGERKRTAVGVELITNPNLIFLDEPTTGLDSFTATNVIELCRELAQSGRTVICTIHQPNSDTFDLFDQLMLMACGKILYFNDAKKAVHHFQSIGYPCPAMANPADFFMTLMSIESYGDAQGSNQVELIRSKTKIEENYKEKINYLVDKYENSELVCAVDEVH